VRNKWLFDPAEVCEWYADKCQAGIVKILFFFPKLQDRADVLEGELFSEASLQALGLNYPALSIYL
jgi:hypothetical protein